MLKFLVSNLLFSIFYKHMVAAHYKIVTPRCLGNKKWQNLRVEVLDLSWSSQHPDSLGCRPSCPVWGDNSWCISAGCRHSTATGIHLVSSFLRSKTSGVSDWPCKQWNCSQSENVPMLNPPKNVFFIKFFFCSLLDANAFLVFELPCHSITPVIESFKRFPTGKSWICCNSQELLVIH